MATRTLNVLYTIFHTIHIPILLLIDTYPLHTSLPALLPLPPPNLTRKLRAWYVSQYADPLFVPSPPAWFRVFLYVELFAHLPVCLAGLCFAWKGKVTAHGDRRSKDIYPPYFNLIQLLFAAEIAFTTAICMAEYATSTSSTAKTISALNTLYVPYFLFGLVMATDMFTRVLGDMYHHEASKDVKRA